VFAAEKESNPMEGQGEIPVERDELGAHVSVAGGVQTAPERAADIGTVCLQLFTKQANRWAEPDLEAPRTRERFEAYLREADAHDLRFHGSHDSYLINLSSPDESLWARSATCFEGELRRSALLGLDYVVTHPGNATDGDLDAGLDRNARGVAQALAAVPGETRVLLEITAGSGTTVGSTFERLRGIIDRIPEPARGRVGICFDTCHAYSAGYDLVGDYDGVWAHFDDVIGLDRLGLFHLNDSKHPMGSRKDRHEEIGLGTLGEEPFRRIMTDPRFQAVPKILETPKGDDLVTKDRRAIALLRRFRSQG
jgi:deoxyribonuclease-4